MARVTALAEPPPRGGPEYAQGLSAAVAAAVDYAIEGIGRGERDGLPVPEGLLAQARRAARSGVALDTVLRRYVAGHSLLGDFVMQEAEGQAASAELKRSLRCLASTLECLLAAVTAAYELEQRRRRRTAEQRRVELVERLLSGEPLEASELGYGLEGHHLGLVASGAGAPEALLALARSLDARLLSLRRDDDAIWAWLGRREAIDVEDARSLVVATWPPQAALAAGEPGEGPGGWRLSHRQARAALPVALRSSEPFVRYADVAMLAATLQDDLLVTSLRRLYLEPLGQERDGGATLRETLCAYFACERKVSSAAVALGIDRRTVSSRLRVAETRIGSSLDECAGELQLALRLDKLD